MAGMTLLGAFLLGWAALVVGALSAAALRRAGLEAATPDPAGTLPDVQVAVVRPCAGEEVGLYDRLVALGRSGPLPGVRVYVTLAGGEDPARPTAERAVAALRDAGVQADLFVGACPGPNRKAAQLAALLPRLQADLVVSADSDVALTPESVGRVVAALQRDPNLAAVYTPPAEHGPVRTLGDRCTHAFLNGSLHAFSLLGQLDPEGFVGKLYGARSEALRRADPDALAAYLGEDMELGRRVRARGGRTACTAGVASACAFGRSLGAVLARFRRWLLVIRAQRPARLLGYPLLIGATLPLTVGGGWVAAAAGPGAARTLAGAAVGLAWIGRIATAGLARHYSKAPGGLGTWLLDALLGELLVWGALLGALWGRTVRWRGARLRITSDGRLAAPEGRAPPGGSERGGSGASGAGA